METWSRSGLRAFQDRDYVRAVFCFEKDLANGADHSRRSATHTHLAVCRMALCPPARRTATQVERIVAELRQAGSSPLVAALASVLTQDWYQRHPSTTGPAPLELPVRVEVLDEADLRLLSEHLDAHLGETWHRLDLHARRHRLDLRHQDGRHAADPDRRARVARYCTPDPAPRLALPAARPVGRGVAWTVTAAGTAALLAAWLSDVLVKPWTLGFLLFLGLLVAGVALLAVALASWRHRATDRHHDRREEPTAPVPPRPSDAEMDRWLVEEVDRIVEYGARRHQLSRPGNWDRQAGPDAPLVLVGLSGIRRDHRYYRDAPEVEPRSWLDYGYAELECSLIQTAARRGERDGLLRANRYDVMVLYPEPDSFFLFRADLDLGSGALLSASTQTVRYDKIITTYNRELPTQGMTDHPITVRYDDGCREQRPVFADRCFALAMPGQRVEITTGISRHRAGPRGSARVAWPNAAAQRMIEQIVWPPRTGDQAPTAPTTEPGGRDERPTG